MINALDKRHHAALAVDDAHPDRVARAFARPPRRGAVAVDLGRQFTDVSGLQQLARVDGHVGRVGHVLVAHTKGLFGGLDAKVDVIGARGIDAMHAQFVHDAQDQQRDHALCRWRHVVDVPGGVGEMHGVAQAGPVVFQVGQRDRAAGAFEVGGNGMRQFAAVVVIGAGLGDAPQCGADALLHEQAAGGRNLAIDEEGFGEARLRQ